MNDLVGEGVGLLSDVSSSFTATGLSSGRSRSDCPWVVLLIKMLLASSYVISCNRYIKTTQNIKYYYTE